MASLSESEFCFAFLKPVCLRDFVPLDDKTKCFGGKFV